MKINIVTQKGSLLSFKRIAEISTVILMLFFVCQSSFSMPVEDVGEWVKTTEVINQNVQRFSQLKQQYDTMKNQYTQLKTQYGAIIGNYGFGNFQNSLSNLKHDHEWAAGDWKSALSGMAGGNQERYKQLLSQYKQNHSSMAQDKYAKGADSNLASSYSNQVKTNQASATTTTYEFNDINKHLKNLHDLGQKIEDAASNKNLKAAVDLNSRIQLEIGFIAVEELRMQTVLNQQAAQVQSAKIALANEASQYNQAGENP